MRSEKILQAVNGKFPLKRKFSKAEGGALEARRLLPFFKLFFVQTIDISLRKFYNFSYIPPWGILQGGGVMENHAHTKSVLNRISRAVGHLNAVKKMIEEGRDCSEVLIQLSAVKAEIVNTSKVVLKDHLDHCVVNAVRENDEEAMRQLRAAIDRLL